MKSLPNLEPITTPVADLKDPNKVFWTMRDGRKIDVDEMTEEHLRNTLKMIIRNAEEKEEKQEKPRTAFQVNGELAQEDADKFDVFQKIGIMFQEAADRYYPDSYYPEDV